MLRCLLPCLHQLTYQLRNLVRFRIQREVPGVEYDDFCIRHVCAVAFRLAKIKREIMLAPDDKEPWLRSPHPRLPRCIGFDVSAVVIEEVALDLRLPWRI